MLKWNKIIIRQVYNNKVRFYLISHFIICFNMQSYISYAIKPGMAIFIIKIYVNFL